VVPWVRWILVRLNPRDDVERRRLAWSEASTRWINYVRPERMRRATGMAQGERGVLVLRFATADMDAMMSGRRLTGRTPVWLNYRDFAALLSKSDYLPLGTAQRWASQILRADPDQDVVLFFFSPPDVRGRSFSRLVTIRGTAPAEITNP
jgi:hypothetical protein